MLSGEHGYWHVYSTRSCCVIWRTWLLARGYHKVMLCYLANMAPGTWIAQGHVVLSGEHGSWHVDSTRTYCVIWRPWPLIAVGSVTSHKPTQRSNLALFAQRDESSASRYAHSYYRRRTDAPRSIVEIRLQAHEYFSIPDSKETRRNKMRPATV